MTTAIDDFNRADSTDLGPSWVETLNDSQILSNALQPVTSGGFAVVTYVGATFTSDQFSEVVVSSMGTPTSGNASGLWAGACVRSSGGIYASSAIRRYYDGAVWHWTVHTSDGAGHTVETEIAAPAFPVTLRLSASGSTLTASLDGAEVHALTGAVVRAGSPGVIMEAQASTRTVAVDSWNAGDSAVTTGPTAVPGLVGWWEADAITGLADGDPVASWPDSSGKALTMAQATASAQPTYKADMVNGLPGVLFDGVANYLTCVPPAVTNPSVIAVTMFGDGVTNTMGSGYQTIFTGSATAGSMALIGYESGNAIALKWNNSGLSGNKLSVGIPHIIAGLGASQGALVDGIRWGGGSTPTITGDGGSFDMGTSGASQFLNGAVMELLVYDHGLTAAEQATVDTYLADKWGVPAVDYNGTAPMWVASTSHAESNSSNQTTLAIDVPSGTGGDLLLAVAFNSGANMDPDGTGWIHLAQTGRGDVWWKQDDGTASYTLTAENAGTTNRPHATMVRLMGGDGTQPQVTAGSVDTGTANVPLTESSGTVSLGSAKNVYTVGVFDAGNVLTMDALNGTVIGRSNGSGGNSGSALLLGKPETVTTSTDLQATFTSTVAFAVAPATVVFTAATQSSGGGTNYTASAAFTGAGTLGTAQSAATSAAAGFTASGALTVAGQPSFTVNGSLNASGVLAATGIPAASTSVSASASGSLAATPLLGFSASADLRGTGLLTASLSIGVAARFTGTGALAATTWSNFTQTTSLGGSGNLTCGVIPEISLTSVLGADGSLAATASPEVSASADLSANGSLSGSAVLHSTRTLQFFADGVLDAVATINALRLWIGHNQMAESNTLVMDERSVVMSNTVIMEDS